MTGKNIQTSVNGPPAAAKPSPRKANLLDHHSIKHVLDESVTEIVTGSGYAEDMMPGNVKLFLEASLIAVALVAQFYPKKFPHNKHLLIGCIALYIGISALLQIFIFKKGKNTFLFTHPLEGSFSSTGLAISSKLPRFSDMYTLRIDSTDSSELRFSSSSSSGKKGVEFTESVTKWFTKDGILVEGLLWKHVDKLLSDYSSTEASKRRKKKT